MIFYNGQQRIMRSLCSFVTLFPTHLWGSNSIASHLPSFYIFHRQTTYMSYVYTSIMSPFRWYQTQVPSHLYQTVLARLSFFPHLFLGRLWRWNRTCFFLDINDGDVRCLLHEEPNIRLYFVISFSNWEFRASPCMDRNYGSWGSES